MSPLNVGTKDDQKVECPNWSSPQKPILKDTTTQVIVEPWQSRISISGVHKLTLSGTNVLPEKKTRPELGLDQLLPPHS